MDFFSAPAIEEKKGGSMSTLVVVAYPNEFQAEEVRLRLLKMQKEYLVDLEDAVIAIRKENGKVKLLQLYNLTGAGAVSGGFWGLLIGLLFMNPLLGAAVGAGAGALSGALADAGIDDQFMKNLGQNLKPGGSMLFILFRSITLDKALQELEGTGGTIIQTSLSHEDEERLRKAMESDDDHECDSVESTISRNAGKSSNLRCNDAPAKEEPENECDAAEEAISRNAGRSSNLRCGDAAEEAAPVKTYPTNAECDAAEEAISRNAGKSSNLRCAPAEKEETPENECDPAEEAISRNADRNSNLRC